MKNSAERMISREGVNAIQAFFESNGCAFHEVPQQSDFGKDAYFDFGENGVVSFLCAALQIKSGTSYRTAKRDYFVPVDDHADNWRNSTVPVFGLVYDPDDRQIRWIDITGYLRACPDQKSGSIPVPSDVILDPIGLRTEVKAALTRYAAGGFGGLMLNLLSPLPLQTDAVYDAWALGRFDAKYLLILRRLIMDLETEPLRLAIFLLSHAGSHPNILWNPDKEKGNWIRPAILAELLPSFRWSPEELARMLRAVHYSDWGYGTLGECVDVLFYEDPNIVAKLHVAIKLLLTDPEEEYVVRAATLALSHSKEQRKELSLLAREFPTLAEHEWFEGVSAEVESSGRYSLYI
jgi:hypothetical protein